MVSFRRERVSTTGGDGRFPRGIPSDVVSLTERTRTRLDHSLASAQREGGTPSMVAGVVRGGELVWSGAAGTLDGRATGPVPGEDVQYRMGSIMDGYFAGEPLHVADGTPSHLDLASFRFSRTPYAVDADIPGGVDEGGWP